jgi:hypothetical protein
MTLLQKINKIFRTGNPSNDVMDVFPFLRYIMPDIGGYRDRKTGTECGQKFFRVSKCKSEYKRTVSLSLEATFMLRKHSGELPYTDSLRV